MASTTGATTRHLRTLYRGDPCWNWAALYIGHVGKPLGRRNYWHNRHVWQVHMTPVHAARDLKSFEFGLCWGRRTLYVVRHR